MNINSRLDVPTAANRRPAAAAHARRETAEICRERAAADLLASVAMRNAHQRARMETSAGAWTQRAEMLQFVEDSFAKRTAEPATGADAAGSSR
jgi:hypothetical protein